MKNRKLFDRQKHASLQKQTSRKRLIRSLVIATASFWIGLSNAAIPTGYYDTADQSNDIALRNSLHNIVKDHQRFPYTSSATDTWDILETADQDPDVASNVITIYKNASYGKQGGGNSFYNREHSWPKSYGFPNDGSSNYPYTDTHHLFIADSGYNSSRSNKPYANCSGCNEKITEINNNRGGVDSNWTAGSFSAGSWETWNARKGDVARALMYMDVRYAGGTHGITGANEPDLILTDDRALIDASNTGANGSVAYMGLRSTLIQWHKDDPVDDFERRHTDTVYSFQGNRNPFIDHPEYVTCVFENICNGGGGGGDITPPSSPTNLAAVGGAGIVNLNWDTNLETDLAGYNVYRSTTSGGATNKLNAALISSTSYADNNVTANVTYFYLITAVDTSGNESTTSNEDFATPSEVVTVPSDAWINEFHYDNASSDVGEFVEIAGSANLDLAGWQIVAYNGNGGGSYKTTNLSGIISNQQNGFGTISFAISSLQNGAPDGFALVDNSGAVIQFLSYEGTFTATNGVANGMVSTNIGVSETSSTPVGDSLQLTGTGQSYSDFVWQSPSADSPGAINAGQTFSGVTPPQNQPPIAVFSSSCSALTCSFNASTSSDPDGQISAYSWAFGDGNQAINVSSSNVYSSAGTYTVVLTVTDDQGATDVSSQSVTVSNVNVAPTASFSVATTDLTANFTDTSSDSDGSISSWNWDFGDASTSSQANPSHVYAAAGTYTVSLTVTDNQGATNVSSQQVTVTDPPVNQAPVSSFTFTTTNLTADFTDSSTDSDGSVTNWNWNFGDGSNSAVQNPSNLYTVAGTYTVSLIVTDNQGATSSSNQTVTVVDTAPNTGGYTVTVPNLDDKDWAYFTINVPAGAASLYVSTSGGSGSSVLYVKFGSQPAKRDYDCKDRTKNANDAQCNFNNPQAGTWHIGVRAKDDSTNNVQLDAYWSN